MFDFSIKVKSYFVIILMIGCFALLYPKILHPMLLHLIGIRTGEPIQNDFVHPRDRHVKVNPEHSKPYTGHSPHPGRMNSEKQAQGSRGGIMTMVLPVYAIGIICYLIYTLVKVFGGSRTNVKKDKRDSILKNYYRDFHYDPSVGNFKMNYNEKEHTLIDDVTKNSSYHYRSPNDIYDCTKTLPHDLEVLLQKVDERSINEEEMNQLRIRLEQTEAQLTRILAAMEQIDVNSNLEDSEITAENDNLIVDNTDSLEKTPDNYEDCTENLDNSNVTTDSEIIHRRSMKTEHS